MFQKIVVQLRDEIEFSWQTTLRPGYNRRKESVNDLERRQEEQLQRSLICTAIAWTLAVCGDVYMMLSTVTGIEDVIDYHVNSTPVIKSQDDLIVLYNIPTESPQSTSIVPPLLICTICPLSRQDGSTARQNLDQSQLSIIPPFGASRPE